MNAFVVYESMYGNTAAIGEAIATALRAHGVEVDSGPVTKIDPTQTAHADLIVVGGPTHMHGISSAATRKQAVKDEKNSYPEPTVAPGLREWVKGLATGTGRLAAAFDTRIDKSIVVTGSAAKGIGRRLQRRDYRMVVPPECFLVSNQNRLLEGEVERAAGWGTALAERLTAIVPSR
jgi:flavodoxin